MRKEMIKSKRKGVVPVSGISSVITIFAVLCLITFSLLVLSTVSANHRLHLSAVENRISWYEADCEAQEVLARLRAGETPEEIDNYVIDVEKNVYSYSISITDTLVLRVKVEKTGGDWKVLSWKEVYEGDWTYNDTIEIWDGDITDLDINLRE